MTIYSFNFGIGWASSGVEYAQAYRAKLLREEKYDMKFIFTDFINTENIQTLTRNIGFKDSEVIWLYQYFTDINIAPSSYTVSRLIEELGHDIFKVEQTGRIKRLYFSNDLTFVTCYLKNENNDIVERAEFVTNGMLVRQDFYSYTRIFSEYFIPKNNRATLYMRTFFNKDGSVAYTEYINEKGSHYSINGMQLFSKQELIGYFIQQLNLQSKDILILDRVTKLGQPVFQNRGTCKIGVVIHAEHYSEPSTTDNYILWNNHYEYQFMKVDEVDFYITSTEQQKFLLAEQFSHYYNKFPVIKVIPVGSIQSIIDSPNRVPFSIITASRLASEKHIDWLIKAVVKAKQILPDLYFDIYGEGIERAYLTNLIETSNASSYIELKGHVDLTHTYSKYELFLSGSTSEGFGLTLMEAVGSGLGIIGLDVNYGNPTFIKHQQNGYLIEYQAEKESINHLIDDYAQYIISYFNMNQKQIRETSYQIASLYKTIEIKKKWKTLFEEVLDD